MEGALAIFAPLLGHCFAATIATDTVDRHCFSDVYNGAHVRDVHVVTIKGKQVYAGETVYSDTGKKLEFTYVNSFGGVGHGTATRAGPSIDFTMTMQAKPNAERLPYTARWTLGPDDYSVSSDGKPAVRFSRVR